MAGSAGLCVAANFRSQRTVRACRLRFSMAGGICVVAVLMVVWSKSFLR
jgi:hypothetical protein